MRNLLTTALLIGATRAVLGQPAWATEPMLSCLPSNLRTADTLILRFSVPHSSELAISAPDRTSFFLVYEPSATMPAGLKPLLSKDSFQSISEIKLPASSAEGTPWVSNRTSNERIFTLSGDYEI